MRFVHNVKRTTEKAKTNLKKEINRHSTMKHIYQAKPQMQNILGKLTGVLIVTCM